MLREVNDLKFNGVIRGGLDYGCDMAGYGGAESLKLRLKNCCGGGRIMHEGKYPRLGYGKFDFNTCR